MLIGPTHASVPPATITLAAPSRTILNASPIAWAPVAHAVDTAWFGPCARANGKRRGCLADQ
jgi:hypothetical protein